MLDRTVEAGSVVSDLATALATSSPQIAKAIAGAGITRVHEVLGSRVTWVRVDIGESLRI